MKAHTIEPGRGPSTATAGTMIWDLIRGHCVLSQWNPTHHQGNGWVHGRFDTDPRVSLDWLEVGNAVCAAWNSENVLGAMAKEAVIRMRAAPATHGRDAVLMAKGVQPDPAARRLISWCAEHDPGPRRGG